MTLQRNSTTDRRATVNANQADRALRGRDRDWRASLRNPRWNAAPIANPEMHPTRRPASIAFWIVLGATTFLILLVGYGSGFWR